MTKQRVSEKRLAAILSYALKPSENMLDEETSSLAHDLRDARTEVNVDRAQVDTFIEWICAVRAAVREHDDGGLQTLVDTLERSTPQLDNAIAMTTRIMEYTGHRAAALVEYAVAARLSRRECEKWKRVALDAREAADYLLNRAVYPVHVEGWMLRDLRDAIAAIDRAAGEKP